MGIQQCTLLYYITILSRLTYGRMNYVCYPYAYCCYTAFVCYVTIIRGNAVVVLRSLCYVTIIRGNAVVVLRSLCYVTIIRGNVLIVCMSCDAMWGSVLCLYCVYYVMLPLRQ